MSNTNISEILDGSGFKKVAYAIRHSTVIPQYWKGAKKRGETKDESPYEVRYGLGAEFKRKSVVTEEFLVALTSFMQSYSQENSQVLEGLKENDPRQKYLRKDLRTPDIKEIAHWVDKYGSELVAKLLVAYGYAREPREDNQNS